MVSSMSAWGNVDWVVDSGAALIALVGVWCWLTAAPAVAPAFAAASGPVLVDEASAGRP
jgi:hypothetical protein